MAFKQFFSSFDLKLWAGADLSFTYNNCTTDICHFILRCHKQSNIKIVLTKITFENQMKKNSKWLSPYRTHGSSFVPFWTKTKSVCKSIGVSNHLLSSSPQKIAHSKNNALSNDRLMKKTFKSPFTQVCR
jgi:hypothetical protein